ncbi:MAG TPA: terminase small subunit [Acetobacteraceae bacterium]|nr:terminase small subunit [Acetobacteraceae bacterium]
MGCTPTPSWNDRPEDDPRQRRFVDEYLLDLNATQAAIRAGYSARTAEQQGPPRLLGNAEIAAAIQTAQQARSARVQITQDDVLRGLPLGQRGGPSAPAGTPGRR